MRRLKKLAWYTFLLIAFIWILIGEVSMIYVVFLLFQESAIAGIIMAFMPIITIIAIILSMPNNLKEFWEKEIKYPEFL